MYKMNKREFLNELENLTKPEFAYFLGFLWGDGHIRKNYNAKNTSFSTLIQLAIQKEDGLEIASIFKNLDFVKIHERTPKNRKTVLFYHIFSREIYEWLDSFGYSAKSWESPKKLLKKIPDHLKPLWYRGLIDADGSFNFRRQSLGKLKNKPYMSCCLSIFSGIEQDWTYMENLYKELDIKYNIEKRIRKISKNKTHHSSQINISKRKDILRFCQYIYKNRETDKIGLERKWKKFKAMEEYDNESRYKLF